MKSIPILITGGAGYIGSHAVNLASQFNFFPITIDNFSAGHPWAILHGASVKCDLKDKEKIRFVFKKYKPQAVMHFVAHTYVGESVQNPKKYYEDNIGNALNVLSIMLEFQVKRFIFSSSCAVYGNPIKIPISENHPKNPVNPYGESKWFIEKVLQSYDQAYGMKSCCLRYFNAAGADKSGKIGEVHQPETHLIPLIFDVALKRSSKITIFGNDYPTPDKTCIRDYIHVTDLAQAHFLALKYLMATNQSDSFNLGTGRGYSVREVIQEVQRTTKQPIPYEIGLRRAGDPAKLIAQARKARLILKWTPRYSDLRTIIKSAWQWHKSYFGKTKES